MQSSGRTGAEADIIEQVRRAVGVRPRIEFTALESIYAAGRQTKAVRFVDRRT
jgi:hypothetical protein